MRENKLWNRLSPKLKHWGEVSRVENAVEPGMWDIFYTFEGQMGWLETKIVHSNKLYFEKFQIPWGRRYWRKGANQMFILAGLEDTAGTIGIYHVKEIVNAPTSLDRKWTVISLLDLNPQVWLTKPYDWERLRLLLSTPFPPT